MRRPDAWGPALRSLGRYGVAGGQQPGALVQVGWTSGLGPVQAQEECRAWKDPTSHSCPCPFPGATRPQLSRPTDSTSHPQTFHLGVRKSSRDHTLGTSPGGG